MKRQVIDDKVRLTHMSNDEFRDVVKSLQDQRIPHEIWTGPMLIVLTYQAWLNFNDVKSI